MNSPKKIHSAGIQKRCPVSGNNLPQHYAPARARHRRNITRYIIHRGVRQHRERKRLLRRTRNAKIFMLQNLQPPAEAL